MPGKKRGNNEGSIRQRPDGSWEGRYTDAMGKRHSVYGKTRAEAAQKLNAVLQSMQQGTYVKPDKVTVSQWLYEWLRNYVNTGSEASTSAGYQNCIDNYLVPYIGFLKLQDLKQNHVQACINQLAAKGLSSATIRKAHAVLRNALNKAQGLDLIVKLPCAHTELPKDVQNETVFFTRDEQQRFIESLPDDANGRALLFMLGTGLRVSELLALRWQDVDGEIIHIRQAIKKRRRSDGKGVEIYIGAPKSKKSVRDIPLNAKLSALLGKHRAQQNALRLQSGSAWTDNDLVFPNTQGNYQSDRNIANRVLSPALKAAGIAHCGTHTLRHTFATRAIEGGVDVRTLSELLGHADVATTLRRYVHSTYESKSAAMTYMETFLEAR